jgi:hypothetical protein
MKKKTYLVMAALLLTGCSTAQSSLTEETATQSSIISDNNGVEMLETSALEPVTTKATEESSEEETAAVTDENGETMEVSTEDVESEAPSVTTETGKTPTTAAPTTAVVNIGGYYETEAAETTTAVGHGYTNPFTSQKNSNQTGVGYYFVGNTVITDEDVSTVPLLAYGEDEFDEEGEVKCKTWLIGDTDTIELLSMYGAIDYIVPELKQADTSDKTYKRLIEDENTYYELTDYTRYDDFFEEEEPYDVESYREEKKLAKEIAAGYEDYDILKKSIDVSTLKDDDYYVLTGKYTFKKPDDKEYIIKTYSDKGITRSLLDTNENFSELDVISVSEATTEDILMLYGRCHVLRVSDITEAGCADTFLLNALYNDTENPVTAVFHNAYTEEETKRVVQSGEAVPFTWYLIDTITFE